MKDINSMHAKAYFNILQTSSWIDEQIKNALKPLNLTHAQLNILHVLFASKPQPLSANELKSQLLVSSPDLTRILDRLVKKELVDRKTCPENRRKIDISITPEGELILDKAHEGARKAVHNFFEEKITEDEARELRRILHKIRD